MRRLIVNILCVLILYRPWRHRVRDTLILFHFKDLFIKKSKYDFIFSMGEACFVADILKMRRIRPFSGPFDWMAGSSFETRMKVFSNRFARYFERDDLVFQETGSRTSVYKNAYTGLIYNHDFSAHKAFDEQYDSIRAKYDRRIKRLTDCLEKPDSKVLILYCEMRKSAPLPTEQIVSLVEEANKVYGNRVDLIYFRNDTTLPLAQAKLSVKLPHVTIFDYLGSDGGETKIKHKEEALIKINAAENLSFVQLK